MQKCGQSLAPLLWLRHGEFDQWFRREVWGEGLSSEVRTKPLALPLRCAASLRLAPRPYFFAGAPTRGHRPTNLWDEFRQVVDLPRIGVAKPLVRCLGLLGADFPNPLRSHSRSISFGSGNILRAEAAPVVSAGNAWSSSVRSRFLPSSSLSDGPSVWTFP